MHITGEMGLTELRAASAWDEVLTERKARANLENEIFPKYLMNCRWFGGKAKVIRSVTIATRIPIEKETNVSYLLLLDVGYTEGTQNTYLLPLSFALTRKGEEPLEELAVEGERVKLDYEWLTIKAKMLMEEYPQSVIARLRVGNDEGILYDASYDDRFRETILTRVTRRRRVKSKKGDLVGLPGKMFRDVLEGNGLPLNSQVLKAEQSNTSILYEDRFYFKLFLI